VLHESGHDVWVGVVDGIQHGGAAALTGLDESHLLEAGQRLSQGGAVDLEGLGQLPLGGEVAPRREAPRDDRVGQGLDELIDHTRADLPPPDTRRWVASRKAVVVKAVIHGLITQSEALERYALSEEELTLWRAAVQQHGETALKVTTIQKYRQL